VTARKKLSALLLCIIIFLTVGCSESVPVIENNSNRQGVNPGNSLNPNDGVTQESMRITVYHATKDAMNLVSETHVVDKNDNPARTAIALLAAEPVDKSLTRVMPASAKLLSLKIQGGIAYANFTPGLTRFGGGSATEILLVAAIVNTLTEFPEIKAVQILIDGKKVQTLGGHLDLSDPLSRSEGIIKRVR
jgi:spore germination protein GerM